MSKITSITSSDEWNVVLYDDGTAVLVRRILSSAGDNPLTTHEQMVEEFREKLAQAERERDEARAALAVERQHRDGHLPSCAGIDREEGRCGCGYLDGTAYRDMTERMEQAVALLLEAQHLLSCDGRYALVCDCPGCLMRKRIDAFLSGQPAPANTKQTEE